MKQETKRIGKKLLGFLLTLVMAVGLFSGMGLTVYADEPIETSTLPTAAGNYILTDNVTIDHTWQPVDGITLNLNGKTITMTGNSGSVIAVMSGVTFTLEGSGTITGGKGSNERQYLVGGGVMVNGGTFIMNGGTISGNVASGGSGNEGGGVWVGNGGTFTMNDGEITNNTGVGGGVGIGVNGWNNGNAPGTFNMNGGSISNNNSTYASGIRLNNGTFNMNGGSITGGGSNYDIHVDKDGGSRNRFNLSGNITIGTIRFDGGMKANIEGKITNTSAITVYMDEAREFTDSSNIANNEAGRFVSGLNGYVVLKNNAGQLYLGNEANYAISFEANGGSGSMTTEYVVEGGTYSLPDCRFTPPANKEFKAWEYDGTEYNAGDSFTSVSKAMTFTAIWEGEEAISKTVTFRVVNGAWDDESTADKTVVLTGYEGDTFNLAADQIPAVGTKPNDNYKAGNWDVTPSTDKEITADTTYTYTYAKKDIDTSIETEVNASDDAPTIKVDNLDNELAEKLLTDEEMAEYENGTHVLVYLDVEVVDKSDVPAEDITAVEKVINADGYIYGECLDLSLWKRLGAGTPTQIHDTNGNPIKITISIPDALKNVPEGYTRTYRIVRVHDGVSTVLAEGTGATLEISSDKFSSYFIIYKDVKDAAEDKKQDTPTTVDTPTTKVDTPTVNADTPKAEAKNTDNKISTGDKINIGIIVMLMIDSAMAALYLTLRRKMIK